MNDKKQLSIFVFTNRILNEHLKRKVSLTRFLEYEFFSKHTSLYAFKIDSLKLCAFLV